MSLERIAREKIRERTMVTGGFHSLDTEGTPQLNNENLLSFRAAVKVYAELARYMQGGLGVVVDDTQYVESKSTYEKTTHLPEEYKSILEEYGVESREVEVFRISELRKDATERCNEDGYFKKRMQKEVESNSKEDIWIGSTMNGIHALTYQEETDTYTASLTLAIAALHAKQESEGYERSVNIYAWGMQHGDKSFRFTDASKGIFFAERNDLSNGDHSNIIRIPNGMYLNDEYLVQLRESGL
jgi:hypothetical protein